jgi:hypothetical protein
MSIRGRVLRDPSTNGPGLLVVEGQQLSFLLEGTWKSLTLPKPGLEVEVEFNQDGTVSSLVAVPEAQLAREQAQRTLNAARERSSALAASALERFGMPTLAATGALVLGWFFLNALTFDAGVIGRLDFTFWRILAFLNSSNGLESLLSMRDSGGAGIYGLLAWLALAGPFVGAVWNDRRAMLGGLLPLAFMLLVALIARASLSSRALGMPAEVMDAAQAEIRRGISLGMGAYVSILAALYLGFNSVKKFLAAHDGGS